MAKKAVQKNTVAKRKIAEVIALRRDLSHSLILQIVQEFLEEMVNELAQGHRLEFRNFGIFELIERKPRMALNPKTLAKVAVPRKVVVKFKAGRMMKRKVAEFGQTLFKNRKSE